MKDNKPSKVPEYKRHASGQGFCRCKKKNIYFGKYELAESRLKYERWVNRFLANGMRPPWEGPKGLRVSNIVGMYQIWANDEYRKNGKPTKQISRIKVVAKIMNETLGSFLVNDVRVDQMEALRRAMVTAGWTRGFINSAFSVAKSIFKWAGMRELLSMEQAIRLGAVHGVKKGRTAARESKKIRPVPATIVQQTLPHLGRITAAMVQVQLLAGMRPVEVCLMRPCDIDTSTLPWVYTPHSHKNEHWDQERLIRLGPRAREVLAPFFADTVLHRGEAAYLFSPYQSAIEMLRGKGLPEKTNVDPHKPYDPHGYTQAIRRACKRGGLPHWFPMQLRHTAATLWRARFGLDVTATLLGHASLQTSQIYAERNSENAERTIEKEG
jgi:integrase